MCNTSKEHLYREQAIKLVKRINKAKRWLGAHKPSLGAYGEYLLTKLLTEILSNNYDVCQGFIVDKGSDIWISNQCDLIIYKKNIGIIKSLGNTKLVDANSVVAVIEVKTSIMRKTFHSTLKTFEELSKKGIHNTFIFVYGRLTRESLSKWVYSYNQPFIDSDFYLEDGTIFDWPDKEWLAKGITSLESNTTYTLSHAQYDNGDWIGYLAYQLLDHENKIICSLQEFFHMVLYSIGLDSEINYDHYSMKNGIPLFRM